MGQVLAAGRPRVAQLGGAALPLAGRARVYACGITPYDVTHLGHAATFVWVDTLARVLGADGTEVIVCRNVTDVDDVLLAAAGRAGAPYGRFAAIQQFYFDQDMAALGVRPPALQPRAHVYIGQVIALAAGLLARGAAYERDGQVYFRGARGPPAGSRTHAWTAARRCAWPPSSVTTQRTRARTTRSTWPCGRHRPGTSPRGKAPGGPAARAGMRSARRWRCMLSARPIDIHAGGGDLRFPHHAYQAALAETFTGVTPFARARMNVGVVSVAGAKMAKSSGNLVLADDLLKDYPAAAIRLLILDRPWDADWDYDRAGLDAAAARLERLQAAAGRPERSPAGPGAGPADGGAALDAVHEALARDLDVPAALRIAEDSGGQAARVLGSLLGLW